jgi:O-antigen/teichoic acid export membrane protein
MTGAGSTASARASLFSNLLKGTALYSLALFSYRIASVILLPVNTRFLNPSDYGVLELLEQIVIITSVILGLNISSSLGYFFFEMESAEERNRVASTTILGATLMGVVVALLGCLLARPIGVLVFGQPGYTLYLVMMFISLPVGFGMEAELSWLRVTDQPNVFALTTLIRVAATILATLALVAGFRLGVLGVVTANLISAGVAALSLTIYCRRKIPLTMDLKLLIRMARFSIPVSLGSVAMFIIHFGDRFILPHYRPLSELGIYGIGYKIGMMITLLSGSFSSYWSAQIFPLFRREDANQVIARVFTYFLLVLSISSLGLIVFSRPAILILTTPKYESAAAIAPVIVIAYYFRSLAEFFRCFFIVHGHPEYESVCNWTGAVVCLAGYFTLIPRFGMWGAGFATVLAFVVIVVMSVVWTYRLKPFQFELSRILKITGVFVGVLVVYYLVPVSGPTLKGLHLSTAAQAALQIVWGCLLMLSFAVSLWVLRVASPGEVEALRRFCGRLAAARGILPV